MSETFLDGRVKVMQPESGFRSGLDAVMLAMRNGDEERQHPGHEKDGTDDGKRTHDVIFRRRLAARITGKKRAAFRPPYLLLLAECIAAGQSHSPRTAAPAGAAAVIVH